MMSGGDVLLRPRSEWSKNDVHLKDPEDPSFLPILCPQGQFSHSFLLSSDTLHALYLNLIILDRSTTPITSVSSLFIPQRYH